MTKVVNFNFSDSSEISQLDKRLVKIYAENDKVKFVFDVTNLTVSGTGNITKVLELVKKFKSQEHKLECIDIACPKSHIMKREIIKKCIKMAKVKRPIYLIEKV